MRKNIVARSSAVACGLFLAGSAVAGVVPGTGVGGTGNGLLATNATRFEINADTRAGHMLIIPYYTVQERQSTAFHITNTDTVNGKAVKVRFRGAVNSDDVNDFQVFLSPGDVWAAEVMQDPASGAMMVRTVDNSCTLPQFTTTPNGLNPKLPGQNGYWVSKTDRLGGVGVEGTREGYIEIFNMADIRPPSVARGASPLYDRIKHNKTTGIPSCAAGTAANPPNLDWIDFTSPLGSLENEVDTNTAAFLSGVGFDTPSTGLTSDWFILNLVRNTSYSWAALAIEAVRDDTSVTPTRTVSALGNVVYFPQSTFPVSDSLIDGYTADPLLRIASTGVSKDVSGVASGAAPNRVFGNPIQMDLPDMSTPYLSGSTDPRGQAAQLSLALEAMSVSNQYSIMNSPAFDTDWVFTMPTRRYSVAIDYTGGTGGRGRLAFTSGILNNGHATNTAFGSPTLTPLHTGAPFFHTGNVKLNPSYLPTGSSPRMCLETTQVRFMDREERTSDRIITGSPATAQMMVFCGETSIIHVGPQKVLGADIASQYVTPTAGFDSEGWAWVGLSSVLNLPPNTTVTPNVPAGSVTVGIPMMGYAALKANNAQTGQNFGYTWPHRFNLPR